MLESSSFLTHIHIFLIWLNQFNTSGPNFISSVTSLKPESSEIYMSEEVKKSHRTRVVDPSNFHGGCSLKKFNLWRTHRNGGSGCAKLRGSLSGAAESESYKLSLYIHTYRWSESSPIYFIGARERKKWQGQSWSKLKWLNHVWRRKHIRLLLA